MSKQRLETLLAPPSMQWVRGEVKGASAAEAERQRKAAREIFDTHGSAYSVGDDFKGEHELHAEMDEE